MYYISMCTDTHMYHRRIYTCIVPKFMLSTCKFYVHIRLLSMLSLP